MAWPQLRSLLLVGLLACLACGSSSGSSQSNEIPSPDQSEGAGAYGVVYSTAGAGTSLSIADTVSSLPAGAMPRGGVEVRMLDRTGNVQAITQTDSDGSFSFSGLEITHAVLEARRNATTEDPDYSTRLTLVREKSIAVGASYGIDFEAAARAAGALASSGALVACTQNPLPAGTLVFPTFGNLETGELTTDEMHTISTGGEWFCLADENITAQWAHPVSYLFIHAEDGTVTTETHHWLPSINFIPIWDYEGDLFHFDYDSIYGDPFFENDTLPDELNVTVSSDVVRAPTDELAQEALEALADFREAWSQMLTSWLHIPHEDWFALLWAGSPETWFFRDLAIVRHWATTQGIPAGNIKSVIYGSDSFSTTVSSVSQLSASLDPLGDSRGIVAQLAAKIKERRDNGGHPVLFVYSVSHGNSKGQLLVVENVVSAIGRYYLPTVFGDQTLFLVDELLPIHTVPACKIRWVLSNCYGGTHLQRLITAFSSTDQDVEIYTASGYAEGKGASLGAHVAYSFRQAFFGPDDEIIIPPYDSIDFLFELAKFDIDKLGTDIGLDWVKGSSLDPEFELTFSESLKNTFHQVSSLQEAQNYKDDPSRPSFNDRMSWDPMRPDPCGGLASVSITVDDASLTLAHTVGESSCPQSAGSVNVTNSGSETVSLSISDDHAAIDASLSATSLAAGESATVPISFNCEVAESFSAAITVSATGSDSGESASATISVEVTVIE